MVGMFRAVFSFVFVLIAFAVVAEAYQTRLIELITDDVEIEFHERLQNAALQVLVLREKNHPQVHCRISDSQFMDLYKWAYCKVDLEVRSMGLTAPRTCTFLYHFHPRKKYLDLHRGNDADFDRCLESFISDF